MRSALCFSTTAVLASLFLASWETSAATAQDQRGIDIETFRPSTDGDGFLGLDGTTTPGPGQWNVGLWLNYSRSPLRARRDGERFDLIRHRTTANFLAQFGIGGRVAVSLDVPLILHQQGYAERLGDGGGSIASQAFGDPRISVRARFLGNAAGAQRTRQDGPGLALQLSAFLPAGSEDDFAGDGHLRVDLQALADFRIFDGAAGLMLGWRHRFEHETIGGVRFRDQLMFGFGLEVPIPILEGFGTTLDVRGLFDARFASGPTNTVEGDIGFFYRTGATTFRVGVGRRFTRGVGSASLRVIGGLTWAPRASDDDADLDGVPDSRDECPHLPEDFDGFEDEDGCLDPDNDNDFIPDVDDQCPMDPADEDADLDEDGCTDS